MQNRRVISVLPLLLALALPFVFIQKARAIPAFTRQYRTECITCHTIYPDLNEDGQAFLKNGYVYAAKPVSEKAGETPEKGDGAETQTGKGKNNEGILLAGIPV